MFVRAVRRGLMGALDRLRGRAAVGSLPGEAARWRFPNHPELVELDASAARLTGAPHGRLPEVLEFPELYQAQPELRHVPVDMNWAMKRYGSGIRGQAHIAPGRRRIEVSSSVDDPLATLLHEVQHVADSQRRLPFTPQQGSRWAERVDENRAVATQRRSRLSADERARHDPWELHGEDIPVGSHHNRVLRADGSEGGGYGRMAYYIARPERVHHADTPYIRAAGLAGSAAAGGLGYALLADWLRRQDNLIDGGMGQ